MSLARIAAPGPFSAFPGIDRSLVVLEGAGLVLCSADWEVRPAEGSAPFPFSGDEPIHGEPIGGPVRVFNAMARRRRVRHRLTRRTVSGETRLEPAGIALGALARARGTAHAEGRSEPVAAGDTLVVDAATGFIPEEPTALNLAEFRRA